MADDWKHYCFSCTGLFQGRAGIFWNCTLWPLVLLYHSIVAYFLPCLGVYLDRAFTYSLQIICSPCLYCFWPYEDNEFFGENALGKKEDGSAYPECDWVRAGSPYPAQCPISLSIEHHGQ